MSTDTHDNDGYKSPPASVVIVPRTPITGGKIPIDEFHTCPCCIGKGYVGIVKEKNVHRNRKRDVLGKLFPYEDGV